jgi:ABC-type Mn2+/Zn2+ transport system permease subunit
VRRRWTWVAWFMVVLFVVGYGVGVPLSVANGKFEQDSSLLLAFAAFMAVGAIIVAHRPGNAVAGSSRLLAC